MFRLVFMCSLTLISLSEYAFQENNEMVREIFFRFESLFYGICKELSGLHLGRKKQFSGLGICLSAYTYKNVSHMSMCSCFTFSSPGCAVRRLNETSDEVKGICGAVFASYTVIYLI